MPPTDGSAANGRDNLQRSDAESGAPEDGGYVARIVALLDWLYRTEQPEGAIMQHHGHGLRLAEDRYLSATPYGWENTPVVVLDVRPASYSDHPPGDPHRTLLNGIRPGEVEFIASVIRAFGKTVWNRWNGQVGSGTASLALAEPAAPSLRAAVDSYRGNCPTHDTVFCSSNGCSWFADGHALVVMPTTQYPAKEATL